MKRIFKEKDIPKIFFINSLIILIIVLFVGFAIFLFEDISKYRTFTKELSQNYYTNQKEMIKSQVTNIVNYTKFRYSNLKEQNTDKINSFSMNGYKTANLLYNINKKRLKTNQLKEETAQILDSLNREDMKYFIIDKDKEIIENNNISDNLSGYLSKYTEQISYISQNEKEGFIKFTVENDSLRIPYLISFHYFQPFDWIIAAYMKENENYESVQSDILYKASKTQFGKNGYIFIFNKNGVLISHPQNEILFKNMLPVSDTNGVFIAKELIKIGKEPDGGYLSYIWYKPDIKNHAPKISYSKYIDFWKWTVCAGIYVDDIEAKLRKQKAELFFSIRDLSIVVLLSFFMLAVLTGYIAFRLSKKIGKDLSQLIEYIQISAQTHIPIKVSSMRIHEFRTLSLYMNQMLEEREDAENKLQTEKDLLSATIKSIGDGVISTDEKGSIKLVNKQAEEILALSAGEIRNKRLCKAVLNQNKDQNKIFSEKIHSVIQEQKESEDFEEHIYFTENDIRKIISFNISPIKHKNVLSGFVFVFRDITQKKKIEAEIEKSRKLESLGLLAGGIAHDFNNILTGILGNHALMKMNASNPSKIEKYIDEADKSVIRAKDLTRQLLTFSKGGAPIKEEASIREIIIDTSKFVLRGSNIKNKIIIDENIWLSELDRNQISQVISNLVINAKQAMPKGGVIEIKAFNKILKKDSIKHDLKKGKYVQIEIRDEGIGIPENVLEQIFDPYFTTKAKGNGLGLATVYSIIKKHDGYIGVKSKSGEGTVFTIILPSTGKPDLSKKRLKEKSDHIMTVRRQQKILVMDDEQMVRDVFSEMLKGLGYIVDTVPDGDSAVEKYKEKFDNLHPYDIVIMDLTIPGGMGGEEAVKRVLDINPEAKVIVASGYSNSPVMSKYKKYGFKQVLVKPFTVTELKNTLDKL